MSRESGDGSYIRQDESHWKCGSNWEGSSLSVVAVRSGSVIDYRTVQVNLNLKGRSVMKLSSFESIQNVAMNKGYEFKGEDFELSLTLAGQSIVAGIVTFADGTKIEFPESHCPIVLRPIDQLPEDQDLP